MADPSAGQLLQSLRIDSEPVVRSNCIWALGRLYDQLVAPRQQELVEALVDALLHVNRPSVMRRRLPWNSWRTPGSWPGCRPCSTKASSHDSRSHQGVTDPATVPESRH